MHNLNRLRRREEKQVLISFWKKCMYTSKHIFDSVSEIVYGLSIDVLKIKINKDIIKYSHKYTCKAQ